MVFEGGTYEEAIRFGLIHECGIFTIGLVPQKGKREGDLTEERPLEDVAIRLPSASQEKGHQQTRNLLVPWSWTSQAPELWKISVYCLSHQSQVLVIA